MSQNNLFGTGNALSLQVNTGRSTRSTRCRSPIPTSPTTGVGLGVDLYKRNVDSTSLDVGPYKTSTLGAGLRFLVPITETDTINYGIAAEQTDITTFSNSPQQYIDFVNEFGNTNTSLPLTAGWTRDRRDSAIFTTSGTLQNANLEVADATGGAALLPGPVLDPVVPPDRA